MTFRDLWKVSLDVETCAARCATGRIAEEQLKRLRANLEAIETAMSAGGSISQLDVEFHTIIAEATGNPALLLAREPVSLLFYPALEKLFQPPRTREFGPRRLFEAHSRIVAVLESGDTETAAGWMHKHLVDFRRGYDVCGFVIDAEVRASAAPTSGTAG